MRLNSIIWRHMLFAGAYIFSRVCTALRVGGAISLVVILAACGSLWPSAKVNTDELGASAVGQFLRSKFLWEISEDDIARGARELLISSASKSSNSRSAAESIGMHCESLPSTTCRYLGKVAYRFEGLPQGSVHRDKQAIITVHIELLSYTNLNNLTVHKTKTETLGE
jgi:hypothetical protein